MNPIEAKACGFMADSEFRSLMHASYEDDRGYGNDQQFNRKKNYGNVVVGEATSERAAKGGIEKTAVRWFDEHKDAGNAVLIYRIKDSDKSLYASYVWEVISGRGRPVNKGMSVK